MSSTTYDILTRLLTRLMSNIPDPEPRFQLKRPKKSQFGQPSKYAII